MALTEEQQAAQDSIHDIVKDSVETIGRIRYGVISGQERDKLLRELQDNLWNIDTLRRNC
jgi:hypothetical protein